MVVLYDSINVLNLMRDATGSQCKEIKRGVTWALNMGSYTYTVYVNKHNIQMNHCVYQIHLASAAVSSVTLLFSLISIVKSSLLNAKILHSFIINLSIYSFNINRLPGRHTAVTDRHT